MIVALYALALAMIVGGLLAAILGWDIVLVERGWTMVISGIIGASGGAVLLGIAVIVSKLARIEQELARVQLSLEDDVETVIVPTSAEQARGRIIDDVESDRVGALAGFFGSRHASSNPVMGAGDQDTDTSAEVEETRLDDEEERVPFELRSATPPELTEPPAVGERSGGHEIDEVSEGKVPDFLFAERYHKTVITETQYPEREAPAFAPDPDSELADEHAAGGNTDIGHEDVFETELSDEAEPAIEPEPEESSASDEIPGSPAVIGTYNSGDNKYVMFSDGSIEAETPQGFFRFASLDELKEFIAAGGEGGSAAST